MTDLYNIKSVTIRIEKKNGLLFVSLNGNEILGPRTYEIYIPHMGADIKLTSHGWEFGRERGKWAQKWEDTSIGTRMKDFFEFNPMVAAYTQAQAEKDAASFSETLNLAIRQVKECLNDNYTVSHTTWL